MIKHLTYASLTAALLLAPALGCDDGDESAAESTSAGAGEANAGQRVEVNVTASGYDPSEVEAHAGQPLTMVFTRTQEEGCGDSIVIADADIERELPLNQPVEVTFTPDHAGELRFTCGMDMLEGKIVVR